MRLFSEKVNYSLNAILKLVKNYLTTNTHETIQIKELADTVPIIPKNYLVQLLILLKKQGIVESERGKSGGYRLLKPPNEIKIIDIIEAVEGPINMGDFSKESITIQNYWYKKEHEIIEFFGETIQDILNSSGINDFSI